MKKPFGFTGPQFKRKNTGPQTLPMGLRWFQYILEVGSLSPLQTCLGLKILRVYKIDQGHKVFEISCGFGPKGMIQPTVVLTVLLWGKALLV